MKQLAGLLRAPPDLANADLTRIFRVSERADPSHCYLNQRWLQQRGSHLPGLKERFTDLWIQYSLMLMKIPILSLNLRLPD